MGGISHAFQPAATAASAIGSGIGAGANIVGSGLGTVLGAPGKVIFGNTPPNPQSQVNSVDPRLQQMRDQQIKAAQDYASNLPSYEKQQANAATDVSRQNLAQQLAGTTSNSNARGLLYGSYNQGAQANMAAQNQAALQSQIAGINQNAQNTLQSLQGQALGTGVNINQTQQAQNALAYQIALQQQQSNNNLFGALTGAAGSGIGLLAAG